MSKKVDLDQKRTSNDTGRNKNRYSFARKNPNSGSRDHETSSNNSEKKQSNASSEETSKSSSTATGTSEDNKESSSSSGYETTSLKDVVVKFPKTIKLITMLILLAPLALLFLFVIIIAGTDEDSSGSLVDIYGKEYYSGACTNVKYGENLMSIEDYVARVIAAEVSGFPTQTLRASAIAARTYVIQNGKKVGDDASCYYEADHVQQAYNSGSIGSQFTEAANDTRGLIIVFNGSPRTYYDASCVYTAEQAKEIAPDGTYSSDNYYIRYGKAFFDTVEFQVIPKSEGKSIGSLDYYSNRSISNGACTDNHGMGMSQNGSVYLEQYKGMNYEQIIDFYYNKEETIKSIYRSYGYSGEYPIEPNNELYSNLQFLINKSFSDFLNEHGSTTTDFVNHLNKAIDKAGAGTRDGVISAGVTLIGSLAEMGTKLNYQWGGKYQTIGINPNWGTSAGTGSCYTSYAAQGYNVDKCLNNYKWQSFDCSGFVTWAVINGTKNQSITQSQLFYAKSTKLDPSKAVCQPGGVLQSSGHIVLVVGIDDSTKNYIVAESTGSLVANNTGGVKLSYYSYGASGYWCSNLNEIYGD